MRQRLRLGREVKMDKGSTSPLEIRNPEYDTQRGDWQPGRCRRGTSLAHRGGGITFRVIGEGSTQLGSRRKEFYRQTKDENRNPNSSFVGLGSADCQQKKVDLSSIAS